MFASEVRTKRAEGTMEGLISPREPGNVSKMVACLNERLNHLHATLEALEDRVSYGMRPEASRNSVGEEHPTLDAGGQSPLFLALALIDEDLHRINQRVERITKAIDL